MNRRIHVTAFILLSLSATPASAVGVADAGPMIAEQGNAALQSIRSELTQTLGQQLREQIDLCTLAVRPRSQVAAASTAGRVEVASQADEVPAPHCASRREV